MSKVVFFFVAFLCGNVLGQDVLIIGDSISLGWQPAAQANSTKNFVHAFNGSTFNNQGTRASLRANPGDDNLRVENYITQADNLEAIIFNAGIHDMRVEASFTTTLQEYEDNLNLIYDVLDQANVPIFWTTTTPVPELHPTLDFNDHPLYREVGLRVASERADYVIDLHLAVVGDFANLQTAPDNLHFTTEGSQILGELISQTLEQTIGLGDLNFDHTVSFADIPNFIVVLVSGEFQTRADINRDEVVNFLDIIPFAGLLQ